MRYGARRSRPSWKAGFARSASGSANPGLWRGLVGLWMPPLGPTGLTLRDVSGYGEHSTLTNMVPATDWVMTEKGSALDFDASNDVVVVPDSAHLEPVRKSIVALVRLKQALNTANYIVHKFSGPTPFPGYGFNVTGSEAGDPLRYWNSSGAWMASSGNPVAVGEWTQVAVTDTGFAQAFYSNARPWGTASRAAGSQSNTRNLWIGAEPTNLDNDTAQVRYGWDGEIAYVAIYRRVLSLAEIKQLYQDPYALVRQRAKALPAAVAVAAGGYSNVIIGGGIIV